MRGRTILQVLAAAAMSMMATSSGAQTILSEVGFERPEAARYDVVRDQYIVSNLGSGETENDGFISRVSPDGSVVELKWIAGGENGVMLSDPLGVFLKGDLLYVADTAAIRIFDRRTGAPHDAVDVPGAVRLNDLVVADDGTVYITDSGSSDLPGALYTISAEGVVSEFVERDASLERPNGISITADGNIVHGGLDGSSLFFRSHAGELVRERKLPTGKIDGIVTMPDGDLLVASQLGHNVYRVSRSADTVSVVANDIAVPAAIGLDTKRMRLLVPQIRAATLTLVELAAAE